MLKIKIRLRKAMIIIGDKVRFMILMKKQKIQRWI